MPAAKAQRVAERKAARNRPVRTLARNRVAAARAAIEADPASEEAAQAVVSAQSALAEAANRGVLHPNNAARRVSRLTRQLNRARANQDS